MQITLAGSERSEHFLSKSKGAFIPRASALADLAGLGVAASPAPLVDQVVVLCARSAPAFAVPHSES